MANQDDRKGVGPRPRTEATAHERERAAEPTTEIAAPEGPERAVGLAQEAWGNALVGAAMQGESLQGLGHAIAGEIGLAMGGVGAGEGLQSNASLNAVMRKRAVHRAIRDAGVDWTDPSLVRLRAPAGGQRLSAEDRARFEAAFGHDFSDVRVHADAGAAKAAEALNAHAFALGADLFFGAGEYAPGSARTDRLLAHELTHVVQHDEGRLPREGGVSQPSDPHEQEAYANESRVLGTLDRLETVSGTLPPPVADRVHAHLDGGTPAGGGRLSDLQALARELGAASWFGRDADAPTQSAGAGIARSASEAPAPAPAPTAPSAGAPGAGAGPGVEAKPEGPGAKPASPTPQGTSPKPPPAAPQPKLPAFAPAKLEDPRAVVAKAVESAAPVALPEPEVVPVAVPALRTLRSASPSLTRATSALGAARQPLGLAAKRLREMVEARVRSVSDELEAHLGQASQQAEARLGEASSQLDGVLAGPRATLDAAAEQVPERLVAAREATEAGIGRAQDAVGGELDAKAAPLAQAVEDAVATLAAPPDVLEAVRVAGEKAREQALKLGGADVPLPKGAKADPRREEAEAAAAEIDALTGEALHVLSGDRAREILAARLAPDDARQQVAGAADDVRVRADADVTAVADGVERARGTTSERLDALAAHVRAAASTDAAEAATRLVERATSAREALADVLDAVLDDAAALIEACGDRPEAIAEVTARLEALQADATARIDALRGGWQADAASVDEALVQRIEAHLGGASTQAEDAVGAFTASAEADLAGFEAAGLALPDVVHEAVDPAALAAPAEVDTAGLEIDVAGVQTAVLQAIAAIVADLPRRFAAAASPDQEAKDAPDPAAEARPLLQPPAPPAPSAATEAPAPAPTVAPAGGEASTALVPDLAAPVVLPTVEAKEPKPSAKDPKAPEAEEEPEKDEEAEPNPEEAAPAEVVAIPPVVPIDPKAPIAKVADKPGKPGDPLAAVAEKADPKAEAEALKAEQESLQARMDELTRELEDNQEELEDVQEEIQEVDEESAEKREDLEAREKDLNQKAERAKKKGLKPRPPESDGTVQSLKEDIEKDLPEEKEDLEEEAEDLREERAEIEEEQQEVSERLEEVAKRLQELQPKGGGGGGGGGAPPPEPNIAKTSAKLAGVLKAQAKPKVDKELKDAKAKVTSIETALKGLDTKEGTVDSQIATAEGAITAANTAIAAARGELAAREQALLAEATEDKPAVAKTADAEWQKINGRLTTAQGQLGAAQGRRDTQKGIKATIGEDRKKKKKELDDAKAKVKEAEEKVKNLETAISNLGGAGDPTWEAIAAEWKVSCPPVPLAPGETNEEHGHEPPPDPEKEKEKTAAEGDAAKDAKASSDAAKGKEDPNAGEKEPEKAEKPKSKEELDKEEKEKKKDAVTMDVTAALELPPEERKKRFAELQKKHKLPEAELRKIKNDRLMETAQAVMKAAGTGKYKTDAELYKGANLTAAQIKALQANARRIDLEKQAMAITGGTDGAAAVDKLHEMGKSRNMKPGELIKHLEGVDPSKLPPDMAAAAKNARALKEKEIAAIPDEAERKRAEKKFEKEKEDANKSEKDHQDTQALAKSLECTPEQAKTYIDRLAEQSGGDRAAAAAALMKKGKVANPLSPAETQKELQKIQALPPKERAAALAALSAKCDPQTLVGATMVPSESDPDGFIDGPMGNESLKNQVAEIEKLPLDQQAAAWRDLGEKTGQDHRKLYAANKRYQRKQSAHNQYFAIQNDNTLQQSEKDAKIKELADRLNTSVDRLEISAARKLQRTKAKLETAKGWIGGIGGDGKTKDALKEINADLKAGKISPEQARQKIGKIAKDAGIPPDDLQNLNGHEVFKEQQAEWSTKLKMKPASKASDYVARKAREEGIRPEDVMDWLRFADPSKMSEEDKKLRGNVGDWHKKNPTKAEKAEQKARKAAGLGKDGSAYRVEHDPVAAEKLTGKAREDYEAMAEAQKFIRDELNDTVVDEKAIFDKMKGLTKAQRAALMRAMPELRQKLVAEINNNLAATDKGKAERRKFANSAAELMDESIAYNQVLSTYGEGPANAAGRKEAEEKGRWAQKVQEDTIAAKEAAKVLDMPLQDARANLQAYALGTGKSFAEAVAELKNHPDKTPKQVLKEAYAAKTEQGGPSDVLKRRLAAINALPPLERKKALEQLKGVAELSDEDIAAASKAMARDGAIAKAMHDLRNLPAEERAAEMKKLAARYELKEADLDAIYEQSLKATAKVIPEDLMQKAVSGSYKDVQALAKQIAAETHLPMDEVLRSIQARRDAAFADGGNASKLSDSNLSALQKHGADCNKSPEEMLDYLMRSRDDLLPKELRELKAELQKQLPDYKIQYSEAEQKQLDKLRAKADDPAYCQRASDLKQALIDEDASKVKEALAKMNPAERALFQEQWEAERRIAKENGEELPAFDDAMDEAVDNVFEDVGLVDSDADQILDEIPDSSEKAEQELLAAVKGVDREDESYTAPANAMAAELRKGADADPDVLKEQLRKLSPAQRAAFLEDYQALQNHAAQTNLSDDLHTLPNLQEVLKDDPEALRWVMDAQRIGATGIAAADAAETKKVEDARRIAGEAAAELKMDRRQAYRLVTQMAEDHKLSAANALRFIKGDPLVPDAEDNLPAFVKAQVKELKEHWKKGDADAKPGDLVGGHSLNDKKVNEQAEKIEKLESGGYMTPGELQAILQKCNPRELKELDAKLGGKLRQIIENTLAKPNPYQQGADVAMYAGAGPGASAAISETDRQSKTQIANLLHGMDDFAAEEKDLVLIDDVAKMDPRASADPSTPHGLAQRMAWAATLPPEQRIKAFNELRDQLPKASGPRIMGAYLNGQEPVSADGMLTPALLAEVQRIELLPAAERAEALKTLSAMTGRAPDDLRIAATETTKKLVFAKEMHEIEQLPPDQQIDKLNELAERSKMSLDELQAAYDSAITQGQIERALKPVGKDVALRLDEIKAMTDPAARKAALQKLAQENGLTQADLLQHLNARLEDNRKKRAEVASQRKAAQKLDDVFAKGDADEIKKTLEAYRNKPEELKKIAAQMGGMDKLREKLKGAFGEDSNEFVDLNPILSEAESATAEPELPAGVAPEISDEINRVIAAGGDWRDAIKGSHPDLTEADLAALEKHAAWKKEKLDRQVAYAQARFDRELGSDWIEDDRIEELLKTTPPDVLLALADKLKPRDLVAEVQEGVGEDLGSDFAQRIKEAREVAALPPAERAEKQKELRVAYKYEQLKEEFDKPWYQFADDARIAELLRDCSPEELKLLNAKFGGMLESKIDENTGGISVADVVGGLTTVLLAPLGPMAVVAGLAIREQLVDASDEQDLLTAKAKIRNGEIDYSKPPEQRFPLVQERVDKALEELQNELHKDLWTSDGDVIGALKGLNPRELQAVVEAYEKEHGTGSLMDQLRQSLGEDAYARAVAMVDNANDAMSGTDRAKEMQDRCRELAIADRLKQLRKDPQHKDKSEYELYALVEKEGSRIDQMAAERVKKIKDSANNIFKAVDGWWNDDTDAMLKEMAALSPEEVDMVKIEYRRHFGRDFDLDIRSEMGFYNREEMKVAERLMSSDPDRRVEGLRMYLLEGYRMFDVEDEQMIFDTLEKMSVEERTKLVTGADGKAFLAALKDDLGDNERLMVDALTHLNEEGLADANPAIVAAAKMKMHVHGSGDWWDFSAAGTKEEELISQLSDLTPAQVREAELYYNQHLAEDGSSFVADLKDDFGDGRDWQIIEAELRGDKVSADAHRLKWATQEDNWLKYLGYDQIAGTDEQLLEQVLTAGKDGKGGRDAAHLAAVRGRFNHLFGGKDGRYGGDADDSRDALTRMLDEETTGIENVYFRQLAAKGEADDAVTLLYAMDGAGTDEEKVKSVLEKFHKMSKEDREAFRDQFRQRSKELLSVDMSLDDWVESETSGGEGFDNKLLLMGEPKTPEEKLAVARMRWDFERGAGSGFGNVVMGVLDATGGSHASEILGENMAQLEACFDEKGKLLPGAADRFDEIADWQEMDVKTYRETKDSVAEAIGNTVAAVGAVAAGIATAGAAWYIMAAAAAAAAAAGTVFKAAIKGNSYGWEEGLADVGNIAVAALTAGMGGAFKGLEEAAKLAQGLKKYAIMALQGAIEGAIESFLNAMLTSEEAWAQGDVAFLTHILKSTAIGTFNGAAGKAVGGVLEDHGGIADRVKRIESGNPLAHSAGQHWALKYANGVAEAAIGTAIDPSNWEAWADGKELSLADVKAVFVMPAISAAMQTAAARNKGADPKKLEDDARAQCEATRGQVETLTSQRDDLSDPAEIAALDRQIAQLKKDFDEQRQSLEWIVEDNKALAERDKAKQRVEDALDRPTESTPDIDDMEAAHRTAAMRDYVEQMDDEPIPASMRPDELADNGYGGDDGPASLRPDELADNGYGDGNGPGSMRPDELADAGYGHDGPVSMRSDELGAEGIGTEGHVAVHAIVSIEADPHALTKAIAGDLPKEAAAALSERSAAASTEVFADPANRTPVQDHFADLPDSAEVRAAHAAQLVDTFGGDFVAAMDAFHDDSPAVKEALLTHRDRAAREALADSPDLAALVAILPDRDATLYVDSGTDLDDATRNRLASLGIDVVENDSLATLARLELSAGPVDAKHDPDAVDAHRIVDVGDEAAPKEGAGYEEMGDERFGTQRMLDNTDRVIEREALSTLRDSILDDAEAALADDPETARKKVQEVADLLRDTPGQEALARAIELETDPRKALEAARAINDFGRILDIDPNDLTPEQLTVAAKGLYHLQKVEIDFLKVAAEEGLEAARAKHPHLAYRKVYDMDAVGGLFEGKFAGSIAGYVGDAANTDGIGAHQAIARLGLGYSWMQGDDLVAPFYAPGGRGFRPDDLVAVLDFAADADRVAAAKIPVHPAIRDHVEAMAAGTGPDADLAKALLPRLHEVKDAEPKLYLDANGDPKDRDFMNPHTGTGAGRAGMAELTWNDHPDASSINVEQKIHPSQSQKIAAGDQVSVLDADGNKTAVATFDGTKWNLEPDAAKVLTPEQLAKFEEWTKPPAAPAPAPTSPAAADASSPAAADASTSPAAADSPVAAGVPPAEPRRSTREVLGDDWDAVHAEALDLVDLEGTGGRAEKRLQVVEQIAEARDPEVAQLALSLLRDAGDEGTARLAAAFDAAASHSDPEHAAAVLKAEIERLNRPTEIAQQGGYQRANEKLAAEATAALKEDPNAQLSPAHAQAMLDTVVDHARLAMMAEMGTGLDDVLQPEQLAGFCDSSQGRVESRLRDMGAGDFVRHTTNAETDPSGKRLPHTFEGGPSHYFAVVRMPDGNDYLVDPTFAQFLQRADGSAGDVGRRMTETPEGAALASALTRDGYVRLTPEVAAAYGRALTGRDGFTEADFLTTTQGRDLSDRKYDREANEAHRDEIAALPEREPGADYAAPRKQAFEERPEVAAYLDQVAAKYVAAVNDFDSPDAPARRKQAEQAAQVVRQIARIRDPELARQAFELLLHADPAQQARLADLIGRSERKARSAPDRAEAELALGLEALAPRLEHGTSSAVPGSDYKGDTRPSASPADVKKRVDEHLAPTAARYGYTIAADGRLELPNPDGTTTRVRVVTGPPGDDRAVARFERVGDEIVVTISDRALDHHVERALAHELAEIHHATKHPTSITSGDALRSGSDARQLSAHDVGRIAELEVISRQARAAEASGDPALAAQLRYEAAQLASHLGLDDDPDGVRRQKIAAHLGGGSPVLDDVDAFAEEARRNPYVRDLARLDEEGGNQQILDAVNGTRQPERRAAIMDEIVDARTEDGAARRKAQVEASDARAAEAVLENRARDAKTVAWLRGDDLDPSLSPAERQAILDDRATVDHVIVGGGFAATAVYANLPESERAGTLAIGGNEPWLERDEPMGQIPAQLGVPGFTAHPSDFELDPGEYANAQSFGKAAATTRADLGMPVFNPEASGDAARMVGQPILNPRRAALVATGGDLSTASRADQAMFAVPIGHHDPRTGEFVVERYVYTSNLTIASGPGVDRDVNEGVMPREQRGKLRDEGRYCTAQEDLVREVTPGERVVYVGAGQSAAWASDRALRDGAAAADLAGSWSHANRGAALSPDEARKRNQEGYDVGVKATTRTSGAAAGFDADPILRFEQAPDGRVVVVRLAPDGTETRSEPYDRVVSSQGQDQNLPGGSRWMTKPLFSGPGRPELQPMTAPSVVRPSGRVPLGLEGSVTDDAGGVGRVRVVGPAGIGGPTQPDAADAHKQNVAARMAEIPRSSATPVGIEFHAELIARAARAPSEDTPGADVRLSRVAVLLTRLQAPDADHEPLRPELTQLCTNLGLVGEQGPARMARLRDDLGADNPLVIGLERHVAEVNASARTGFTHDDASRQRRAAVFDELDSLYVSDAKVLTQLRRASPAEIAQLEAEWDELHAMGRVERPFAEQLQARLGSKAMLEAVDLMLARPSGSAPDAHANRAPDADPGTPVDDPQRDLELRFAADAVFDSMNKGTDAADHATLLKSLTGLDGEAEVARLAALVGARLGDPSMTPEKLVAVLAERLPARDWGEARAHLSGDPVQGAVAATRNALDDDDWSDRVDHDHAGRKAGQVAAQYALSPVQSAKKAVKRQLVDHERLIAVISAMPPGVRRGALLGSVEAAIREEAKRLPPGPLRDRLEALLETDHRQMQAKLAAANLHQAMRGKGRWHDARSWGEGAVNPADLVASIDALRGDPERYERVVAAYEQQRRGQRPVGPDGEPLTGAALLEHDVAQAMRRRKDDGVGGIGSAANEAFDRLLGRKLASNQALAEGREHAADAVVERAKRAAIDADPAHRDTVKRLAAIAPGRAFSADEIERWVEAAKLPPPHNGRIREELAKRGIHPEHLPALERYAEAVRAQETRQKAQEIAAAAKLGQFEALCAALGDADYAKRRAALAKAKDDPALTPEQREQAAAALDKLEGRRKALADAVKEATGKDVDELIAAHLGDPTARDGRWRANRAKWAQRVWENGALDPHEQVFVAMHGPGGPAAAKKALEGKKPEEIAAIKQRFAEDFGHRFDGKDRSAGAIFDEAIADKFKGRKGLAVALAAKGDPNAVFDPDRPPADDTERRAAAAKRLALERDLVETEYDFERGTGAGVGKRAVDAVEGAQERLGWRKAAGAAMDAINTDIRRLMDERQADLEAGDPAAWKALAELRRLHTAIATSAGGSRDAMAKEITGALRLALGLGATIAGMPFTGELAAFLKTAGGKALVAGGSTALAIGAEKAIRGASMGGDEVIGAAATDAIGAATGIGLGGVGADTATKAAVGGAVGSAAKAGTKPETWRADDPAAAFAPLAGDVARKGVDAALGAAVDAGGAAAGAPNADELAKPAVQKPVGSLLAPATPAAPVAVAPKTDPVADVAKAAAEAKNSADEAQAREAALRQAEEAAAKARRDAERAERAREEAERLRAKAAQDAEHDALIDRINAELDADAEKKEAEAQQKERELEAIFATVSRISDELDADAEIPVEVDTSELDAQKPPPVAVEEPPLVDGAIPLTDEDIEVLSEQFARPPKE